MRKIKIESLSEVHKISKEEMKKAFGGGVSPIPLPYPVPTFYSSPQQQFSYGYFTNPVQLRGALPIPIP